MSIESLLTEFGHRTGLEDCAVDGEGVCRLVFDRDLVVDLETDDAQSDTCEFVLYASAGTLGASADVPATLRRLLSANLDASAAGDAVLALDDAQDDVVLTCRCTGVGMDYAAFAATLSGFVDQLEYWRSELGSDALPEASAQESGTAGVPGGRQEVIIHA